MIPLGQPAQLPRVVHRHQHLAPPGGPIGPLRRPAIHQAATGSGSSPESSSFSAARASQGPLGGDSFAFVDAGQPRSGQTPGRPAASAPGQHYAPGVFGGSWPPLGAGGAGPGTGSGGARAGGNSNTSRSAYSSTATTTTSTDTNSSGDGATGETAGSAVTAGAQAGTNGAQELQSSNGNPSTSSSSNSRNGDNGPSKPSPEESVAAALARAQDALQRVETSLESIEDLPSARPPSQFDTLFSLARTVVGICALGAALVASQAFGLGVQLGSALACSVGVAWWGYARRALSLSGALAALAVGTGTIGCSLRFGATLLAFFFSCSKLTSFKEEVKEGLDDAHKASGQRDWKQVFCNGAVPTILAVAYGVLVGCVDVPFGPSAAMEPWRAKAATLLGGAFLGYYACCCGDTWASELGPLSSDTPRLITTLRPVRRGTNGGVTLLGLSASILGGVFVGAVFYAAAVVSPTLWVLEGAQAAAVQQWRLVPLGLMAGLLGSVLDSVLGATVQYTGYNRTTGRVTSTPGPEVTHISGLKVLDNNTVNLLSASITSALTALAALKMFGF